MKIRARNRSCADCAMLEDCPAKPTASDQACDRIVLPEDVETLWLAAREAPEPTYDGSWMGENASVAYIAALSAGPWRLNRRRSVQMATIYWYLARAVDDLSWLPSDCRGVFPLDWQDEFLTSMVGAMQARKMRFDAQCDKWKADGTADRWSWEAALADLFLTAGSEDKGAKVLWMFARDFLGIPAFPIDRWVARRLDEHGLPKDPWYITRLCVLADISPNKLSRAWFAGVNAEVPSVPQREAP